MQKKVAAMKRAGQAAQECRLVRSVLSRKAEEFLRGKISAEALSGIYREAYAEGKHLAVKLAREDAKIKAARVPEMSTNGYLLPETARSDEQTAQFKLQLMGVPMRICKQLARRCPERVLAAAAAAKKLG